MSDAFLTSIGLIIVAVVTVGGQWLNSRNDRALAHQEVDLLDKLTKMDPGSKATRDLTQVVRHRVATWERKTRLSHFTQRWSLQLVGGSYLMLAVAFLLLGSAVPGTLRRDDLKYVSLTIGIAGVLFLFLGAVMTVASTIARARETKEDEKAEQERALEDQPANPEAATTNPDDTAGPEVTQAPN